MQVYLSKEFLLEQKVDPFPLISEILHIACIEKPGTIQCIRPDPHMHVTDSI